MTSHPDNGQITEPGLRGGAFLTGGSFGTGAFLAAGASFAGAGLAGAFLAGGAFFAGPGSTFFAGGAFLAGAFADLAVVRPDAVFLDPAVFCGDAIGSSLAKGTAALPPASPGSAG